MDRRVFLLRLSGAGAGLMLGAGAAMAEAPVDAVIRQLEFFGYRNVRVSRTLLGRMRVTGRRGQSSREIVLDPRTGKSCAISCGRAAAGARLSCVMTVAPVSRMTVMTTATMMIGTTMIGTTATMIGTTTGIIPARATAMTTMTTTIPALAEGRMTTMMTIDPVQAIEGPR